MKSPLQKSSSSETDEEESDEELENPESLNRTLSEIIEGKRLGDPLSPTSLLTSSYTDSNSPLSADSKDSAIGSECCASDKHSGSNGSFCDKLSDHSSLSEVHTLETKGDESSLVAIDTGADRLASTVHLLGKCANNDFQTEELMSRERIEGGKSSLKTTPCEIQDAGICVEKGS